MGLVDGMTVGKARLLRPGRHLMIGWGNFGRKKTAGSASKTCCQYLSLNHFTDDEEINNLDFWQAPPPPEQNFAVPGEEEVSI